MLIENIETSGHVTSMRAMRNPMNSWDKSDSVVYLGKADMELSKKLAKAGTEHCKHLRMIQVWMDIEAARYWWQEFDTYKHVEKVSCSTMHKLFENPLTLEDFEKGEEIGSFIVDTIVSINNMRTLYKQTKDKSLFLVAKRMLPESFLQRRTINTNYQQLLNMYEQRKNHKLSEWQELCRVIERLPYFKELTGIKEA